MSHRLYALVTRSAALLILALLVAPLWDSWRYRGLAASGGAAFPVAAIMPAPRRAPDAAAAQDVATDGQPVTTSGLAGADRLAALQAPARGWAPLWRPARPVAATSSGSTFEAWTARAQVDPFWNGQASAREPAGSLPDGPPADAGDGVGLDEGSAGPRRSSEAAGAAGPDPEEVRARSRVAAVDYGTEEESAGWPAREDEPAGPGETGLIPVLWPSLPADPETAPPPAPEPVDPGTTNSSRVNPPTPSPGGPTPAPLGVPVVTAEVATPEVAPGEMLLVAIRIEDADRMTSLPFHLVFDPAVIEFAGSQAGPALATHDPVLLASVSPNRPGDLAVGLSLIESAGTFSGTGDVVTLQFRALAPGRSDLSFSRATLRGVRSEPLEVRFASGSVTVR